MTNRDNLKQENNNIRLFLSSLAQKNYAEANKYLSNAVQHKMRRRVKDSANKIGF